MVQSGYGPGAPTIWRANSGFFDPRDLRSDVVRLASRFGRYGYRQITNLLRIEGWRVNHKRVERIWREEGLKVPRRQPKRGRLWLNDGSWHPAETEAVYGDQGGSEDPSP